MSTMKKKYTKLCISNKSAPNQKVPSLKQALM